MDTPDLAVDFGTSNTVAVVRMSGRSVPLLFDGSPLLPSAVFLPPRGDLLVGRDAERSVGIAPDRLEPNPKRRVDDRVLWLGDQELPVVDAIAAVLRRVVDEAARVLGRPVDEALLTHPAGWGGPRLSALDEAARLVGLRRAGLVPEPVAAAAYFVSELDHVVPVGHSIVVYDLGAGTFDVAVVRRTADGFEVRAADGLTDVGGLDLDAAIMGHVRSQTSGHDAAWGRLDWPRSSADRRARLLLWQDVRAAKEQLSRHSRAGLHVPLVDVDVYLTRDEFEAMAGPLLRRTVEATMRTVRSARVAPEHVAGIVLVGGGSRIPLAATMVHRMSGIAPTAIDQPELTVAVGAHAATPAVLRDLAPRDGGAERRPAAAALPAPSAADHPGATGGDRVAAAVAEAATGTAVTTAEDLGGGAAAPGPGDVAAGTSRDDAGVFGRTRWLPTGRRRVAVMASVVSVVVLAAGLLVWRWYPAGHAAGHPASSPPSGGVTLSGPVALTGDKDATFGVAFSPDGRTMASTSADRSVRLWNLATHRQIGKPIEADLPETAAFSPDGRVLAVGTMGSVQLWDWRTRRKLGELGDHRAAQLVQSLAFSADGRTLAAGMWLTGTKLDDGAAQLWNVSDRTPIGKPIVLTPRPSAGTQLAGYTWVAFSRDGRTLVTGYLGGTIQSWNVSTQRQTGPTITARRRFYSVAFSPGAGTAAVCDLDGVQVWNTTTGRRVGPTVSGSYVSGLAFSPDGRTLAGADTELDQVLTWDVASHTLVGSPRTGHTDDIQQTAFSPNGAILASTSNDGTIRLWPVPHHG